MFAGGLKNFRKQGTQKFINARRFYRRPSVEYIYFNGQKQGNSWNWGSFTQRQKRNIYIAGGVLGLVIVTHIEEAPVTHRKRLMLTSDWVEDMVTESSYRQVISQYGRYVLPEQHPITRKIRSIMTRLITAAHDHIDPETGERINLFKALGKPDIPLDQWEIYVIDDVSMGSPSPNAFVIGGGKVFIFRSILPICKDDNGIATVLSHELGHLLADHIGEKLTASPFFFTLNLFFFSIFGSSAPGDIFNMLLNNSYSREMECEADYIGLMVQSRACFNPSNAPLLWKNMIEFEKRQGSMAPELLSTHPSSERRFQNLNEWMPRALSIYENSECNITTQFPFRLI